MGSLIESSQGDSQLHSAEEQEMHDQPTEAIDLQRKSEGGESCEQGSDQDPEWQQQPKHIFVLSNSGKPALHKLQPQCQAKAAKYCKVNCLTLVNAGTNQASMSVYLARLNTAVASSHWTILV